LDIHTLFLEAQGSFYDTDFGKLITATLKGINKLYRFDMEHKAWFLRLAVITSYMAQMFCGKCSKLLGFLFTHLAQDPDCHQALGFCFERYWRQKLPFARAKAVARFAVSTLGPERAVQEQWAYVSAAVASDRDVCAELAPYLPESLSPAKTFLSLVPYPQFGPYVEICQKQFPPSEWILKPEDVPVIQALNPFEAIQEVYERIGKLQQEVIKKNEPVYEIVRTY
jgi:hypothetical protein